MTIEKLQRVMWRLRKNNPGNDTPSYKELRKAIAQEIGTDSRTYYVNRKALYLVGYIKAYGKQRLKITNEDLMSS